VVGVEQWAGVRRMHRLERLSIREISKRTGLHRKTIRRALAAELPPRHVRAPAVSKLDLFKEWICEQLQGDPGHPVVAVARDGWRARLRGRQDDARLPASSEVSPFWDVLAEQGSYGDALCIRPARAPGKRRTPTALREAIDNLEVDDMVALGKRVGRWWERGGARRAASKASSRDAPPARLEGSHRCSCAACRANPTHWVGRGTADVVLTRTK
jgi:hypothetical protein